MCTAHGCYWLRSVEIKRHFTKSQLLTSHKHIAYGVLSYSSIIKTRNALRRLRPRKIFTVEKHFFTPNTRHIFFFFLFFKTIINTLIRSPDKLCLKIFLINIYNNLKARAGASFASFGEPPLVAHFRSILDRIRIYYMIWSPHGIG